MNIAELLEQIAEKGWCVWDEFLTPDAVQQLRACFGNENAKNARIGRNENLLAEKTIRSDKISWLEPEMGEPVQHYLMQMENIQRAVNREFFLGLFEYEAHFASYGKGAFYKKHLDAFKENISRRLTTVLYLNDNWTAEDGGELVIYDLDDKKLATVAPQGGRLIIFLSEQFPHEVLPTNKERISIAGWFRVNGVRDNFLDIAS
ncbi:2OG-Fe(II) oxygenase [Proteus myxofaciens]|uniref:SM20-related protein n=1 Tax=Proteus myxofaciens ATCC 19692 TaxID=1354337 RepID=A0A198GRS2_9GAMM|nr:2OG-Fe(II) oxygenase [Proteus myxofaciens]OAT38926.1 SM20-related protein [Proteus myxofaciens ATCC 19692]